MTRSAFYGLTLISSAVATVLWASSPDCEGDLCLRMADTAVAEAADREGAPATAPQTPVTAEELERIWAESDFAREATESTPETVAQMAKEPQTTRAETDEIAESGGPEAVAGFQKSGMNPDAVSAEGWSEVADAALSEPDDELRGEAIHAVGLSRNGEAVAILIEVAAHDSEPDNRSQAIQSLWYAAADGLDEDGAIRRALEQALADRDPEIAELAEAALADLAKLETRRG